MATKKMDINEAFATLPEIPEEFNKYCMDVIPDIPVFYKRRGKIAECLCGKCGTGYVTDEVPVRGMRTDCKVCGHRGKWEWKRCKRKQWKWEDITLVQCTKDKNLVLRIFRINYQYEQYEEASISLKERRRYFLRIGKIYPFHNTAWMDEKKWSEGIGNEALWIHNFYSGWRTEIEKSNLKYCNPVEIAGKTHWYSNEYGTAMMIYALNPAVEMYAKMGMDKLVQHLFDKKGKTGLINRKGKTVYSQLRIKDKSALNRLIADKGSIATLEILQLEKKKGIRYTEEQMKFLKARYSEYRGKESIEFLLHYMTLQQLINRVKKYINAAEYGQESSVVREYKDYLEMRMELGYDMTNEVYLYPKSLKEKHNLMVKERNAKKDELHVAKMMQKYPQIEARYKELCKKYKYSDSNYIIRPAKDAGEIVTEGRELHHCVGREQYLSSHNKGRTFILFLRKIESPDIPYYTIEICDKEIIQWYGLRDGKPDKEIIEPWLNEYVHFLENRKVKQADTECLLAAG